MKWAPVITVEKIYLVLIARIYSVLRVAMSNVVKSLISVVTAVFTNLKNC